MKCCYFDWAATAPIHREVLSVMHETALKYPGNPSSGHQWGRAAAGRLQDIRSRCAELLGCRNSQLVFTSGGTESNSMVLSSLFWKKGRGSVVIPSIEHPSVSDFRNFLRESGFQVVSIDAPWGFIDPKTFASSLLPDTVMVCLSSVNNVCGSMQPLEDLIPIIRSHGERTGRRIHIHIDAVQALGKIPLDLSSLDIDSASFSAHKISGPRGVGCLYFRRSFEPLSRGGSQEFGIRPGTENLAGAAGFLAAMELHVPDVSDRLERTRKLRNIVLDCIADDSPLELMQDVHRIDQYSPYILLLSANPVPSEVMLRVLSDKGFLLSAGSACSSKKSLRREGVLTSMGFSTKIASGALRISFGPSAEEHEVRLLCDVLLKEAGTLRELLT